MLFIFNYTLNITVISLLFTLTLKSEFSFLNQVAESNYFIKVFIVISVFYLILKILIQKAFDIKSEKKGKDYVWNPEALGTSRSYVKIQNKVFSEYKYAIDFLLLFFSIIIFLGIYILFGGKFNPSSLSEISNVFKSVLSLFFFYLLYLSINMLFEFEKHLALKRGKSLNTSITFSFIFFLLIIMTGLVYFLYKGLLLVII